jgi:hypothetical protein
MPHRTPFFLQAAKTFWIAPLALVQQRDYGENEARTKDLRTNEDGGDSRNLQDTINIVYSLLGLNL